jgi:hypothetical protein
MRLEIFKIRGWAYYSSHVLIQDGSAGLSYFIYTFANSQSLIRSDYAKLIILL